MRICMFVWNTFTNDSRVLREAKELVNAGHHLTVVAAAGPGLPMRESSGNLAVVRVAIDRNPFSHLIAGICCSGIFISFLRPILIRILVSLGKTMMSEDEKEQRYNFLQMMFNWIIKPIRWFWRLMKNILPIACDWIIKPIRWFRRLMKSFLQIACDWIIKLVRWFRRLMRNFSRKLAFLMKRLLRRYASQLRTFAFFFPAVSVGLELKADVYHAHDFNTLGAGVFCARLLNARLIYDSHELYAERNLPEYVNKERERRAVMKAEARLLRFVDAVITVNEFIADELDERYEINKPYVVMNTPELTRTESVLQRLKPEMRLPSGLSEPILIYAGRLTSNRGLEYIVEALSLLSRASLVILGPDPYNYRSRLLELRKELGIKHRIIFLPPVRPELVPEVCAQATIGLSLIQNSCLSYYLSLPNKLFEYAASGIPVVASDFPAMRQVINEYEMGIVCDPADAEAIADAIIKLTSYPEIYASYAANARKAVREKYNWAKQAEVLLKVYSDLRERNYKSSF